MIARLLLCCVLVAPLVACNSQTASRSAPEVTETVGGVTANTKFGQAADGTVIPDAKPDDDAIAFAARCSGGRGGSIALGMSECDLVAAKGTPSRVVGGLDQQGGSHNAVWYIEGGMRTVYKFDNDKLVSILH